MLTLATVAIDEDVIFDVIFNTNVEELSAIDELTKLDVTLVVDSAVDDDTELDCKSDTIFLIHPTTLDVLDIDCIFEIKLITTGSDTDILDTEHELPEVKFDITLLVTAPIVLAKLSEIKLLNILLVTLISVEASDNEDSELTAFTLATMLLNAVLADTKLVTKLIYLELDNTLDKELDTKVLGIDLKAPITVSAVLVFTNVDTELIILVKSDISETEAEIILEVKYLATNRAEVALELDCKLDSSSISFGIYVDALDEAVLVLTKSDITFL